MFNKKFRQRLDTLFTDIKSLAVDPAYDSPVIKRELEELRARLCELEAEFLESEKRATATKEVVAPKNNSVEARLAVPVLYEKEQVGYAYADEKLESLEDPQSKVPQTDHAMTTPLTAGGQTIGEMQIERRSILPEEAVCIEFV